MVITRTRFVSSAAVLIFGIMLLAAGIVFWNVQKVRSQVAAFALASQQPKCRDRTSNITTFTATTSYLALTTTDTATTTCDFYTARAEKAAFGIGAAASSTGSTVVFSFEFSDNGIDWYADGTASLVEQTSASGTPTVFYGNSTTTAHVWKLMTPTSTTTDHVSAFNVNRLWVKLDVVANYTRVKFHALTDNAMVYVTPLFKEPF